MPMTITITLDSPKDIVLLSRWASVGRTFDSVERGLEQALELLQGIDSRTEVALEEMKDLHSPLETLHMKVRTEMWKQSCGKLVKKMLDTDYNCRLEKDHSGPCRAF